MATAHHAVEPPEDVLPVLVGRAQRATVDTRLGALEGRSARVQELALQGGVRAFAAEVARTRSDPGAPPEPFDHGRFSCCPRHHAPFLARTTSTARIPSAS